MSGRYEMEKKEEKSILENLEGYPDLLMNFFEESAGGQVSTKKEFVNSVKRFVRYVADQGLDIYDEACWGDVTARMVKNYFISIKTKTLADGSVKTLKGRTLENYYMAINMFFDWLVDDEIIDTNPCPTIEKMRKGIIKKERDNRTPTYLTPDEAEQVLERIAENTRQPARDTCMFILGCSTGLRATALSQVDIADIDFENKRMFTIEKGNEIRDDIFLDDIVIDAIKACISEKNAIPGLENYGALFCKMDHGTPRRVSTRYIARMIERATVDLDKHITPHKMRSTCITTVYHNTGNIYAAARQAGHHNIQNTQRYINTENETRDVSHGVTATLFSKRKEVV